MTNNNKKNKDLFFIHRDKIIAVIVLCLFVWSIFGSFVLFENINNSLAKVEPKFFYTTNKLENANSQSATSTYIQMVSSTYPVAVMIDNNFLARPQSGLAQADFIYEAPVEGGATRLMAVINLNKANSEIGPIRSARPYFVNWAAEFQALYVHAGGSPDALSLINSSPVKDLNEISGYGPKYFYRSKQKTAPHNLYTNTTNLKQVLSDFNLDKINRSVYDNFKYSTDTPILGVSSTEFAVDFSDGAIYDARFVYLPEKNIYQRYENNKVKIDSATGLPIDVSNIIIQLIEPEIVLDNAGRLSLEVVGRGNGYLLQSGSKQDISWQKQSSFLPTEFFNQNNKIDLLPGLTWILIIPTDREITID